METNNSTNWLCVAGADPGDPAKVVLKWINKNNKYDKLFRILFFKAFLKIKMFLNKETFSKYNPKCVALLKVKS